MTATHPARPRPVNMRRHGPRANTGVVRIDRATRWGNPFPVKWNPKGRVAEHQRVIAAYAVHLRRLIAAGSVTRAELAALCGKQLACWCAPLPCHGDVLADAAVAAAGADGDWRRWTEGAPG